VKFFAKALLSLIILLALASGALQWASTLQFQRGINFYQKQDWYRAISAFKSAETLFFRDPETHRWLAKSYLHLLENRNPENQLNLLRKAEAELRAALSIEKDYPYYWALLGRVTELIEQLGATPEKSPLNCYHQANLLDPHNPLFLELFASYLIRNGKSEQAKPLISKLAHLYSAQESATLWLEKGLDPMQLIPLFEDDPKAWGELRGLLNYFGHHQIVLLTAQKALESAPDDPEVILVYLDALAGTGDCEKLEMALAKIANFPDYEEAGKNIYASCLFRTKQYDLAEKQYLDLIARRPDSIEYRGVLAQIYLNRKQTQLAKAQLLWLVNHLSRMNNNFKVNIFLNLAVIFENEKNFDQAYQYYQHYLKLLPQDETAKEKIRQMKNYQPQDIIYSPWGKEDE